MRAIKLTFCVVAVVALISAAAQAAPLAPSGLLFPIPAEAEPVGGVVLATSSLPFLSGTYSGTLTSTVISGDTSNPFPGGLTFTYVLSNLAGTHSINRLSINGFDSFLLDASYQSPLAAGAVTPAYVDREATGSSIGYSFVSAPVGSGPLGTGQTSATLVVQTNATSFVPSSAFVLDGFPAAVTSFAPVPEPSTIALAGAALALFGYGALRRSRKATTR